MGRQCGEVRGESRSAASQLCLTAAASPREHSGGCLAGESIAERLLVEISHDPLGEHRESHVVLVRARRLHRSGERPCGKTRSAIGLLPSTIASRHPRA